MTSTHTSLAAACAPARLPLAALLQIPSTLLFTLAESVGSRWTIDLHIATASATPAALAAPLEVVVGDVGAVLGAAVEVFTLAGVLVAAFELLVVELLLPHPATSTPQRSTATSQADRVRIIGPPRLRERPLTAFEPLANV